MNEHIVKSIDHITRIHPYAGVIVMGDFNRMDDRIIKSYPLKQVVKTATHVAASDEAVLDCIYTTSATYTRLLRYYHQLETRPIMWNCISQQPLV